MSAKDREHRATRVIDDAPSQAEGLWLRQTRKRAGQINEGILPEGMHNLRSIHIQKDLKLGRASMRELRFTEINRIVSKFNRTLPAQRWKLRSANSTRIVDFCKLLKRLVPRAGVEPAPSYDERILSPFEGILPDLTKRDEPIFTGLAAVKVMFRPVRSRDKVSSS